MGHTPYGYSIENGCATIKEDETAAPRLKRMKPIKYESSMRITSPGWRWLRLLPLLA